MARKKSVQYSHRGMKPRKGFKKYLGKPVVLDAEHTFCLVKLVKAHNASDHPGANEDFEPSQEQYFRAFTPVTIDAHIDQFA